MDHATEIGTTDNPCGELRARAGGDKVRHLTRAVNVLWKVRFGGSSTSWFVKILRAGNWKWVMRRRRVCLALRATYGEHKPVPLVEDKPDTRLFPLSMLLPGWKWGGGATRDCRVSSVEEPLDWPRLWRPGFLTNLTRVVMVQNLWWSMAGRDLFSLWEPHFLYATPPHLIAEKPPELKMPNCKYTIFRSVGGCSGCPGAEVVCQ